METNIYIKVKLVVHSPKKLTEKQIDNIVSELDYDFIYDEDSIKVVGSEVQEIL